MNKSEMRDKAQVIPTVEHLRGKLLTAAPMPRTFLNGRTSAFCVPTAFSMVFGMPVEEAEARINIARRKPIGTKVCGVYERDYKKVPSQLGYQSITAIDFDRKRSWEVDRRYWNPTLNQFWSIRPDWMRTTSRALCIIKTTSHVLVTHGSRLWDNCQPDGSTITGRKSGKRARVCKVWIFAKTPDWKIRGVNRLHEITG